ncbi:MAG: DNA/RNA non-specific endonuclease [Cytophagales bacterium]|nr:MAG: DNA/RNA non-specific endonuclease [Cytophagales bacterium]
MYFNLNRYSGVVFIYWFCVFFAQAQNNTQKEPIENTALYWGNPSKADSLQKDNFLMKKKQYTLSYNTAFATANWVAWHLDSTDLGTTERQDNFRPDTTLPKGWLRVTTSYYKNSGFDRGHLCPSADRTQSPADNQQTFLMTNIVPQAPNNNQRVWKYLEDHCRDIAKKGYELYIIAGRWGEGGEGKNGNFKRIYNDKISVPAHLWKVIICLPIGEKDITRIDENTIIIAISIPNIQTLHDQWEDYCLTIDELEELTGYDFFETLPDALEKILEAKKQTSLLKQK